MANTLRDPRYRSVVSRLVALRKEAELSQREMAERLGQPQSYVAKVELHERRLDIDQLIEWIRALGVNEREFLLELATKMPSTRRPRS